jgi:nitrogen-specific signal transduction histidine kinase
MAAVVERAKRELEQMIDLNPQVMLLLDVQGTIMRANRAFLAMVGKASFASVLKTSVQGCFEQVPAAFFSELLAGTAGHTVRDVETRLGGARVVLRFTVVPLAQGAGLRVLIIEDITTQRDMEAAAETAHKTEAVRALAGALMHNVNQPLTVISVRAKLALMALDRDRVDVEELRKSLREIMDLTMKISSLLNKVEEHRRFVTEEYLQGLDIVDLERSSEDVRPPEAG